jgi:hypothetical protein
MEIMEIIERITMDGKPIFILFKQQIFAHILGGELPSQSD